MVPYMLPHTFRSIKFGIQSVSVVLTFMINSLLIYLICTRSPKKMGTYRHLMIYFCCCSMFFSMMDIIVQPYIHTYKSAFFMIAEFRSSGVDQNVAEILIGILCACFSVTIYGIAIHFIYRYFALERKGRLKYFNRQFLPIWFSIPIIGGIAWDLVSIIFMPQEPTKTEYIRQTVKDFFDLEVQDSVYCGAAFYLPDETGKSVIHKESFYGSLLIIGIMSVPFGICIVTGWKSWKKVSDLTDYGESDYSKGLQMQLYKALIAQTVIPICFLFLPFGFLFTSPLFELNCQFLSAPCTFLYAIYPAVDPLPILFFVDDYRNSVTEFFVFWVPIKNRVEDSRTDDMITSS